MSSERWRRIRTLFESAMILDESGRAFFLDERCAFDGALRHEVEALLLAYERSETFLEDPALGLASGSRVGPYRVERQIGRGGMGAVYLASRSDGAYEGRVAIKFMRADMISPELSARLRTERQLLAKLDHPNISKLLDGGETRAGAPYLVMEFIDGLPLDQYCEQHRLSIHERLRLARQVCGAVSFAHRNLVIHRDIKPGNILVDGEGTAKLLDFGVARLLEFAPQETLTATISRLFTPEYASPEQLRGERVTTASDEYSLGVLLRRLSDGLPVPEDLKHIIAKATREEPNARYESVQALSDDLGKLLNNEPVAARSGHRRYRAMKFVSRHKAGIMGIAVAVILAIAGLLSAEQKLNLQEERAQAQRQVSEIGKLTDGLASEFASFQTVSPNVRARVLAYAMKSMDTLAYRAASMPGVQKQLFDAYRRGGTAQWNSGDISRAFVTFRKAAEIERKILNPDNETRLYAAEIGAALDHSGDLGYSIYHPAARSARSSLLGPLRGPIGSPASGTGEISCEGRRVSDQPILRHGSVGLLRTDRNHLAVDVDLQGGDPGASYAIEMFRAAPTCPSDNFADTGQTITANRSGDGKASFSVELPYFRPNEPAIGSGGPNESVIVVLDGPDHTGDRFVTDPIRVPQRAGVSRQTASNPGEVTGVADSTSLRNDSAIHWQDLTAFAVHQPLRLKVRETMIQALVSSPGHVLNHRIEGVTWSGNVGVKDVLTTDYGSDKASPMVFIAFSQPVSGAGARIQWLNTDFAAFTACVEAFDEGDRPLVWYCRSNLLSSPSDLAPFIGVLSAMRSVKRVAFFVRGDTGHQYHSADNFSLGDLMVRVGAHGRD